MLKGWRALPPGAEGERPVGPVATLVHAHGSRTRVLPLRPVLALSPPNTTHPKPPAIFAGAAKAYRR
jgi:hypothetical protein